LNAFNRLIMLIVALLLIVVPVFLLLVGLGVIPNEQVNEITRYRDGLDTLGNLRIPLEDTGTRAVVGGIGLLVALVALFLILREIPLGRRVARRAFVEETPGRETAVTAQAVRNLAEGAAREVGAVSPTCYLASSKRHYDVSCNILVPKVGDFTELAASVQQNIRRILDEQQVPVKEIEVTVQGTESQG
jgi:hypothetical protein